MQVAKLYGTEDIRVIREDEPRLEPGTVRVDISYTGVCGSDVHEYKIGPVPIRAEDSNHEIPESEWDEYLPKPMGHEIAGVVSEVGEGVDGVSVGDEVALNVLLSCGECRYCEVGKPQLCTAFDGTAVGSPGFADNMVVPAAATVPVPDGVSIRHAALAEPLSVSVHAVRRSRMRVGDTVAVFGAGPIGLGIVDAAQSAGADRILVSEPRDARRDIASELGADVVVDPREEDPTARFKAETEGGVDVGFEAAGISETLTQTLRSTKYDGTAVVVSVFEDDAQFHPNDIMQAERTVVGSFGYTDEFPITLRMMADGRLNPEAFVTGTVELEDVDSAFRQLVDPDSEHVKILVEP
ncbi:2,3-butanediol dehydrogenase [Halogeometricum sp. S1BR25-6]|uniref:2,3-butanediol dehydrogenase n=1 Tax=Halogeometricum salsisoli TaxID=2950536 RepID=A0ABU2GH89_9EURY|nr:2,3-butanediol dehydrogenase [Halogeometricum sp. S1BR25-6]MDS0300183.1 2,3-butanediol dehydrogenase [Halogeometricum sp. S1BR25-6]